MVYDDCVRGVARLIAALSEGDLEKLADLAENYQPFLFQWSGEGGLGKE